ncbi:hypothetical protein HYPBUDRAFT_182336 [Hyphopichia burtonii NRRL Y-1933]|uniref:Uncharacterized protein n=1 Tax=Hyphopichia burtonii NRRL Y-1933 TaxID=984485 RepID=A0A1E4RT86_9ASCO|nr:hypothetical protein HYPBUDRAFT_182336 [Hyphopichia burtonii NRRL Y-1933]ODV70466.1 hypothetical protein HYPBUDRAFT_182336 [Hyphopichia burtonii NRRL Y-1933]
MMRIEGFHVIFCFFFFFFLLFFLCFSFTMLVLLTVFSFTVDGFDFNDVRRSRYEIPETAFLYQRPALGGFKPLPVLLW